VLTNWRFIVLLSCPFRQNAEMAAPTRVREKSDGARRRLMEATAQIMRDQGYAAATSRRVAALAGVKPALVYYYFATMDDLFLAVLRAGAKASLARMRQAITDDDPLRALWVMNSDLRFTGLYTEFMALANHRKAIGTELKAYAERVRDLETAAVTVALRAHGVDLDEYPPVAVSMVVSQMARSLSNETTLGVTEGHGEFRKFVERHFDRFGSASSAERTQRA
jgi:TetR/AcrR family transcriptional regulator, regulator of autoinduction and epiphytic fitness